METAIPVYLVPNPKLGIKKDCPMELRDKEYRRKVMCMQIMVDMQNGMADEEIIKKYNI